MSITDGISVIIIAVVIVIINIIIIIITIIIIVFIIIVQQRHHCHYLRRCCKFVTCGNDRLSETSISANASAMLVYLQNGSQTEKYIVAPTWQSLYTITITIMKTADA